MSRKQPPFLPYTRQQLDADDLAAVTAALQGERLTQGPSVSAFEAALSAACGGPRPLAVSSGTAALHLALLALDLKPGDAVVVPSVTFVASANSVLQAGGEVVFADVDPESGLMRCDDLRAAAERAGAARLRAVMPVHLGGQCLDPAALWAAAGELGLRVIEDACHAFGTTYQVGNREYRIGECAHSHVSAFSFHPAKTIAMGEGGALTTREADLGHRMARLRDHGLVRDASQYSERSEAFDAEGEVNPWYYELHEVGLNYRASDIHCALGLSQLGKLAGFVAARRRLAARYDALLAPLAPILRPVSRAEGCAPAWHLYSVLIDFVELGISRAAVMRALKGRGIGTQVHYIPVHRQPYYQKRYGTQHLAGADSYYEKTLTLPLFAGMEEADVERVVEELRRLIA